MKNVIAILFVILGVNTSSQVNFAEKELKNFSIQYFLDQKIDSVAEIIEPNRLDEIVAVNYILQTLNSLQEVKRNMNMGTLNYNQLKYYHDSILTLIISNSSDYITFKTTHKLYNQQHTYVNHNASRSPGLPCINIDFEDGTWVGWDPEIGRACTTGTDCIRNVTPGTGTSCFGGFFGIGATCGIPRHQITGAGNDPNIPALSRLNPFNGNQSLRLGNWGVNSEAERISHTFLVPPTKTIYQYAFAVVIEDPAGHGAEETPFFKIEFLDQNGDPINSCGDYFVVANDPNITGFQNAGGVKWKDWARVAVDLAAYVNQNVTVRFTTSDCTQGGHYGYAYLDGECNFPEITLVPQCDGSLDLEAPDGFASYLWNDGSTNRILNATANGNYSVQVTSESGCLFTIDTTITVSTPMTMTYTFEPISCFGENDGEITITAQGGEPPYRYSIDGGVNWYLTNVFTSLSGGVYDVRVREARGCVESSNELLPEPNPLVFSIEVTDITCFGNDDGRIVVNANGGTPSYLYSINNGTSFQNSNTFTGLAQGNYNVLVRDDNRCEFSTLEVIVEPTLLAVSSTPDACYSKPADLIANATGGVGPYSYQWSDNGTSISSTKSTQVNPPNDKTYTVYATDANGCVASTTSLVKIAPKAIPSVNITEGCEDLRVVFSNNSTYQNTASCIWSFGDGNVIDNCNPSVAHVYTDPNIYSVRLTIIDQNGCISDSMTRNWIEVYRLPIAEFAVLPDKMTTINTKTEFVNYSQFGNTYKWTIADLDIKTDFQFLYEFPFEQGAKYNICLEVNSIDGCFDSICRPVVVKDEFLDFTPNVFTPDADGVNDFFKPLIDGISPANYELTIYDRWGKIVFQTNDFEEAWDGIYKGANAVQDAYVWKIKAQFLSNGEVRTLYGHVILTR